MEKVNILIVDDDVNIHRNLEDILCEEGYEIICVETADLAEKELNKKFCNIALVDIKLPTGSGLEVIKSARKINEDTMVIIFTGHASLESAVTAMNDGVFAYLQKPLSIEELKITIKKALGMQKLALDNKKLLARLKELNMKDPLTGIYNYRFLSERLSIELKRAKRYLLTFSVIMIDIDYFKSINDVYGHQSGDLILKELAQYLNKSVRANDVVVRYGGEEFLILLPETSKEGAVQFAERLLDAEREYIFNSRGRRIKLKVSMGISSYPIDGDETELGILDKADEALRDAKEKGGNQLSVYRAKRSSAILLDAEKDEKENIENLKQKLAKMENRVKQNLFESIYAFAKTLEAKDYYTSEHSENTMLIATKIGGYLDFSKREMENLKHAAILHDLGKIGIPDNILNKKGKLTPEEYEIIKRHPQIGAEIIRSVHFLNEVVPLVLYHHEWYDGSGYPAGLKGNEIPIGARIISLADAHQALISDRPYRKAYSPDEAMRILKKAARKQFDQKIVEVFFEIMNVKSLFEKS